MTNRMDKPAESPDAVFRNVMRDAQAEWELAIRNQLRIASCDNPELVKPSEANTAFSNLARFNLYVPERTVNIQGGIQHRLAIGADGLKALGIKATKIVERLPDGSTQVHEEYALGEAQDGDGGS